MEVAVKGGAQVSAKSRDSVIRKKKQRSTVSVFDGSAKVASAGKSVSVPEKYGTSFEEKQAPTPPRPLPPAPAWQSGSSSGVVLAPGGQGKIFAAWGEVPKAVAYRVEVARNADFSDLVVREEVPAKIHAFRAEKMPAGSYYLRVRAIDDEDFLGLAAKGRDVTLLSASVASQLGSISPGKIQANPYGVLELEPAPGSELSVDGGPFGPLPKRIDLLSTAPRDLELRMRGGAAVKYQVEYSPVSATVEQTGPSAVRVELHGFEGVDVARRVQPRLRVHVGDAIRELALSPAGSTSFVASLDGLPQEPGLRFDVVDGRGVGIGEFLFEVADGAGSANGAAVAVGGAHEHA